MSVELGLLKLFCEDRNIETTHYGYLDVLDNLERELKLLFVLVHRYYYEYDHDTISAKELLAYYHLKYPNAKNKQLHLDLIDQVFATEVSQDLLKDHLDQIIEKHHATSIINKLLPVMEGDKYGILDTIRDDIDIFSDLLHNPPDSLVVPEPCELTIRELVEQEILDEGLPWHLPGLTDIIGGARRKTLGLVYAFVDSGKTSFTFASVKNFASYLADTEDLICYCGNEEAAGRLKLRATQAFTNWTRGQIKEDPDGATKIATEHGFNNLKIFDNIDQGHQIEYILKKYRPYLLYVDQGPAVDIATRKGTDAGVAYLEALFKWYRKLCNVYNVGIIAVAQATGDAEDTKFLKLSDIYGTRVAIQSTLDWACGIGRKVNDPVDGDLRYLNIPKNKLHDGDGGRLTVEFNKYLCQWKEL
jgi:hypothetical protein